MLYKISNAAVAGNVVYDSSTIYLPAFGVVTIDATTIISVPAGAVATLVDMNTGSTSTGGGTIIVSGSTQYSATASYLLGGSGTQSITGSNSLLRVRSGESYGQITPTSIYLLNSGSASKNAWSIDANNIDVRQFANGYGVSWILGKAGSVSDLHLRTLYMSGSYNSATFSPSSSIVMQNGALIVGINEVNVCGTKFTSTAITATYAPITGSISSVACATSSAALQFRQSGSALQVLFSGSWKSITLT